MPDPAARFGALAPLLPLTGIWRVESDVITGETSFAWSPGRKFLTQVFDFRRDGRWLDGMEVIHWTGDEIRSHAYFFRDGRVADSVWRFEDSQLSVRRVGSETGLTARLDADGARLAGGWTSAAGQFDLQAFKVDQP
jgi:hypothetical protein